MEDVNVPVDLSTRNLDFNLNFDVPTLTCRLRAWSRLRSWLRLRRRRWTDGQFTESRDRPRVMRARGTKGTLESGVTLGCARGGREGGSHTVSGTGVGDGGKRSTGGEDTVVVDVPCVSNTNG